MNDTPSRKINYITNSSMADKIAAKRQFLLEHFDEIEEAIGYKFKDRTLLEAAFVHDSAISFNGDSKGSITAGLRFLGDSALRLAISDIIFRRENLSEGEMTRIMNKTYVTHTPANAIKKMGLDKYLITSPTVKNISDGINRDLYFALIGAVHQDSTGEKDHIKNMVSLVEKHLAFPENLTDISHRSNSSALQILKVTAGVESEVETTRVPGSPDNDARWQTIVSLYRKGEPLYQTPEDKPIISKTKKSGREEAMGLALDELSENPHFTDAIRDARGIRSQSNNIGGRG